MERVLLRLNLERIRVEANGDDRPGMSRQPSIRSEDPDARDTIITASLEYPSPGNADPVNATKAVDLLSGEPFSFNLNNFWQSGLFKEEILDETALTIAVADRDKRSSVIRFFRRLISGGIGSVLTPTLAGSGSLFTQGVASAFTKTLASAVAGGSDRIRLEPIARTERIYLRIRDGRLEFSEDPNGDFDPVEAPGMITLPMTAPRDIERSQISEGEPNGEVVLRAIVEPFNL